MSSSSEAPLFKARLLKRSEWLNTWNEREVTVWAASSSMSARLQWTGPNQLNTLPIDKHGCAYMDKDVLVVRSRDRLVYLRDSPTAVRLAAELCNKIGRLREEAPAEAAVTTADGQLQEKFAAAEARAQAAEASAARAIEAAAAQNHHLERQLASAKEQLSAMNAPAPAPEALPPPPMALAPTPPPAALPPSPVPAASSSAVGISTKGPGAEVKEEVEAPFVLPPAVEEGSVSSEDWNVVEWIRGAGVHRAVAAALQVPLLHTAAADGADPVPPTPAEVLAFLKGLDGRESVRTLLSTRQFIGCLVDLIWAEVRTLQSVGATTREDLTSKFAGAIELSYSGLDTFFGGLEGVVGSPDPKVLAGMRHEHLDGPGTESTDPFTTGNYGICTASRTEWLFTYDEGIEPAALGLARWPEEAPSKLADRSHGRKRTSLAALEPAVAERNAQLRAANQPEILLEEVIAANLYTGPMFVKCVIASLECAVATICEGARFAPPCRPC